MPGRYLGMRGTQRGPATLLGAWASRTIPQAEEDHGRRGQAEGGCMGEGSHQPLAADTELVNPSASLPNQL